MKKTLSTLFVAAVLLIARPGMSQDSKNEMMSMMPPVPPETKMLSNMVGTWDAMEKYKDPSGKEMSSKGVAKFSMTLGGRYLRMDYKSSMMGMNMEGMLLMNYDPKIKMYRSTWYDSMSNEGMTLTGNKKGDNMMVLDSEEMDMEMGGRGKYRYTMTMVDKDKTEFKLESVKGDEVMVIFEGTYTRRK